VASILARSSGLMAGRPTHTHNILVSLYNKPGGYNIVFLYDLIHIRRTSDGERRETFQLLMGPNVKVIWAEEWGSNKQESSLCSKRFQSELFALGELAKKSLKIAFYLYSVCLFLLKRVNEGKREERIGVTRRRGRRRKQLLDDLKEKRGYWKLKEEALDRTLWRTGFGRR